MSQTREERRTALDDFAATKLQEPSDENLPAVFQQQQTPMETVHGAQRVAVLRDERRIFERLRALAAAAGEEFYYRYPVRNKRRGTTEWIEGPSIKLANDVARIYGNDEVDCRFTEQAGTWIFYSRFVDLETGYSLTRPFRARANTSRLGGDDNERREDISFQIAASKSIRNVIVNALRTYSDFAFEEAKASLVDKIGSDIERWRRNAIDRIKAHVTLDRVEAVVGRSAADWLAPDIARVIAMMKSVVDGMSALNETFPPLVDKTTTGLDEFAASEPGGPDNGSENSGGPINRPDTPSTTAETTGASSLAPQAHGAPVVTLQRYRLCIDKILGAAVDRKLPDPEDRLANLDGPVRDTWLEEMSGDLAFVNKALRLASQVVRKEITENDARRMLEAMVP